MNTKYVMILFYDIPSEESKQYQKFRKYIISIGFVQIQESVYFKNIKNKMNIKKINRELNSIAPNNSNIRSFYISTDKFDKINIISGELSLNEKIISQKHNILDF